MALIVETGEGISNANSYATLAYILNHLTNRQRQDENGWNDLDQAIKEGHAISSTDYVENRFRDRFKGNKKFIDLTVAKNLLTFTTNPIAATTVIIGSRTYTFVSTLASADDVLIGINTSTSIDNLINAVNALASEAGETHGTGTVIHPDVNAGTFEDDTMTAEAKLAGLAGNLIATTTTVTGATWQNVTLTGGTDTGRPQPLSFPRVNIFDREGVQVVGIPDRMKQAIAEYSVRNAGTILQPDPAVTTGLQVIELSEKVEGILETTKWQPGGTVGTIIPYPAADSLLAEYLQPTGGVLRA